MTGKNVAWFWLKIFQLGTSGVLLQGLNGSFAMYIFGAVELAQDNCVLRASNNVLKRSKTMEDYFCMTLTTRIGARSCNLPNLAIADY